LARRLEGHGGPAAPGATRVRSSRATSFRRGSFTSVEDLEKKMSAFIDVFNATMAKPFCWTYQGKPLAA
jgi:hypothetical protein